MQIDIKQYKKGDQKYLYNRIEIQNKYHMKDNYQKSQTQKNYQKNQTQKNYQKSQTQKNYQKSQTQKSYKGSKSKYSQSFKSQNNPSLLQQFQKKIKQVLPDDIRMRKQYQSYKIHPNKNQLKVFLQQFINKPKRQFIQLSSFLIDKYIDLINLQTYLWYLKNAQSINSNHQLIPINPILHKYAYNILVQDNQQPFNKSLNKSVKTQQTQSIKPSSFHQQLQDPDEPFYFQSPPKNLKRIQSLPLKPQIKNLDNSNFIQQIVSPFQLFFENLSIGAFEQACKQKLPQILQKKYRIKIQKLNQESKYIKRIVQYLNSSVLSSDKVKPQGNIKSIKVCLQKINKKNIKQSEKGIKKNNRDEINKNDRKIEQLQIALKNASEQFNKKSLEYSLQKRNYMNEMEDKIKLMSDENSLLNQQIMDLKQILQKKNKQIQHLKQQNNKTKRKQLVNQKQLDKNKQQIISLEEHIINKQRKITQLQNQIQFFQQQKKLQQERRFNLQTKQNAQDNKIEQLEKTISAIKDDNEKYLQKIKIYQKKIINLQNRINQLNTVQKSHQQQKQLLNQQSKCKIQQNLNQLKTLQKKFNKLSQTNSQLLSNNSQLSSQLNKLKSILSNTQLSLQTKSSQLEQIQKNKLSLLSTIFYYTKINYLFSTSDILPPIHQSVFNYLILQNISFLQSSYSQKLSTLKQNKLFSLINTQYIFKQVQSYVSKVDINKKISHFSLLYKFDHNIKTNFHQYIDNKPNFIIIIKLKTGAIIGGYSHQPLRKGIKTQSGFMFSINLQQSYYLKQKYCLIYDEYYLIFGNSQIRIRVGENLFYSNFGVSKAHFDTNDRKFTQFLNNQTQRQQPIQYYQIYQAHYQTK